MGLELHISYYISTVSSWSGTWKWFHKQYRLVIYSFWTERKFQRRRKLWNLFCIKLHYYWLILDKENINIWVCVIGEFYTQVLLPFIHSFIHSFIFSTDLVFAVLILIYLWRIPSSSSLSLSLSLHLPPLFQLPLLFLLPIRVSENNRNTEEEL